MKKIYFILFLLCFAFGMHAVENSKQKSELFSYRENLVKFQPEYTVEANKMLTKEKILESIKLDKIAEISKNGQVFSGSLISQNKFETTDFEFYIWYEKVAGYSKFSSTRTVIAKFPKNDKMDQNSYSIFKYQGKWEVLKTALRGKYFVLKLNEDKNSREIMALNQDIDFPLFFDQKLKGEEFEISENKIIKFVFDKDQERVDIFKRSLDDGEFL